MSPQRDNDYPEDVDERTSTSVDVGRARKSADADAPYVPDPMAGDLTADERSQAPREDREADTPRGADLQPRDGKD